MIKVKTFIQAINIFWTDVEKGKKYFQDKRLTQSEKVILQCFLYNRDNKTQLTIDTLSELATADPIVESQRCVLLGIAYNNRGDFHMAIPCFEQALSLMHGHAVPQPIFIAANNLFIAHANLRHAEGMRQSLEILKATQIENDFSRLSILRAEFSYYTFVENFDLAKKIMRKLDDERPIMSESMSISYLVDKFKYFIKIEDFSACLETLQEMKNYRKFHLSANYNYMKQLLEHCVEDKVLYVKDGDFKDYPVLFDEVKVIQALEESDHAKAKHHWSKLHALNPAIYAASFGQFAGGKCLFSLCLKKHEKATNVVNFRPANLPESKIDALLMLLKEANAPLHQQQIYELLWNETAEFKSDLNKLAQLVAVLRKKTGLDIKVRKSCYYIEKSDKLKKRAI